MRLLREEERLGRGFGFGLDGCEWDACERCET